VALLCRQTKGFPYTLHRLFGSAEAAAPWRDGSYVTLRLTSSMYHRFHAPLDARMEHVTHVRGDAWNVNPIALKRVAGLYCPNERAVIRLHLARGQALALVPVGAILVASIRLHALQLHLHPRYRGADQIDCDVPLHKRAGVGLVRARLDHRAVRAAWLRAASAGENWATRPYG
jgi:phosphatidylserine decarboxylase